MATATPVQKTWRRSVPLVASRAPARFPVRIRALSALRHTLSAAWLLIVAAGGCAYHVSPPAAVQEPATAYVADLGYHASLLLPAEDGGYVEFAYGQWRWFALNEDRWFDAIGAMLIPQRGALARRMLVAPESARELGAAVGAETVLAIVVEAERAAALRGRLNRRWEQAAQTAHYNPMIGMTLVHDPGDYSALHNCNSVVAQWLRELGCRVRGGAVWADFRMDD
ncbi:MAG: hypothetical protein IPM64_10445 [Phycisphaerales bacterium]|nr:hypothetical protein [Phycisphaerales bacterium]